MRFSKFLILGGSLAILVLLFVVFFRAFKPEESPFAAFLKTSLPEATLYNARNESLPLSGQISGKAGVLVFWATWCPTCLKELPELTRLAPELQKKNIQVSLINCDGGKAAETIPIVQKWLDSTKTELPLYFDFETKILSQLKVPGLPFALEYDKKGTITWMQMGEVNWKKKFHAALSNAEASSAQ